MIFTIVTKESLLFLLSLNLLAKINCLTALKLNIDHNNKASVLSKLYNILKYKDVEKYNVNSYQLKGMDDRKPNAKYRDGDQLHKHKDKYNKILVKRLVPHGYKYEGEFEYDDKFKTYYKPLVRVHKNRNVNERNDQPANRANSLKQRGNFEIVNRLPRKLKKFDDEYLLQPFKVNAKNKITAEGIIEDVIKFAEVNSDKKVQELKNGIISALENTSKKSLRSMVYLPPDDLLRLPATVYVKDVVGPDQSKKDLPTYKYWNFWTYDKQIYLDDCTGRLIKWGNICMEPPPH